MKSGLRVTLPVWLLLLCGALNACSSLGGSQVKTLGPVEKAKSDSKSWLLAATPSIVRYEPSERESADFSTAVNNYDIVAESHSDSATRAEAARRAAYLRLKSSEESANTKSLDAAIALYQKALEQDPSDPNNDLALYQLARAYQNAGAARKASQTLRELQSRYPDSALRNDALFRLAELEFQSKEFALAAKDYREILSAGPGSHFFEIARYKLGWAEFRLENFPQALMVFGAILEEEFHDAMDRRTLNEQLDALPQATKPWVQDALKVSSLSLASLGGADGFARHYGAADNEPSYVRYLYENLASVFLEKQYFSEAARVYSTYSQRHLNSAQAPAFLQKSIDINRDSGFIEDASRTMIVYVERFAPSSPYWAQQESDAAVLTQVADYLDTLGRHFHALADEGGESAHAYYVAANRWYQRLLSDFPEDDRCVDVEYLLAESLIGAGDARSAVHHYSRVAYAYPPNKHSEEAAYAVVLTLQSEALASQSEAEKYRLNKQKIDAGLQLAEHFPSHPQRIPVLLQATEYFANEEQWETASTQAKSLLDSAQLSANQRELASRILADSEFKQAHFAAAEAGYKAILALGPKDTETVSERLAISIYRQGEAARERSDMATAAKHFQRLGLELPNSALRPTADYDAAAAYLSIDNYVAAEPLLRAFTQQHTAHPLFGEALRRLAISYEKLGVPNKAAMTYLEYAQQEDTPADVKKDVLWHAAELFEGNPAEAARAYERYVFQYPTPFSQAQTARERLASLYQHKLNNPGKYRHWLEELASAPNSSGTLTSSERLTIAQAALQIGHLEAQSAKSFTIRPPIEQSLLLRKRKTESALRWFNEAAEAGFESTTPKAIFAAAQCYADLASAMLNAQLPQGISLEEQDGFAVILEENAIPFEDLAIELNEQNIARLDDGYWDQWIDHSANALAQLYPAKYAKREHLAEEYHALD